VGACRAPDPRALELTSAPVEPHLSGIGWIETGEELAHDRLAGAIVADDFTDPLA
jgi:hypothetical protein